MILARVKRGGIGLPQVGITGHSQGDGEREQGDNCSIGGKREGGEGGERHCPATS